MYRRFIGRLLVVMMWWVFSGFSKCPGFLIWDIFLVMLLLYDKKEKLDTNNPTSEASYKKKTTYGLWQRWNRWYNIGITPIRDYINHSNTYPRITATIKPLHNTWTSNTSSYMNESETIHECNTWKERPYIKPYNQLYHNRIIYSIILYSIYRIIP